MKFFIFVRGSDTDLRRLFVKSLIAELNPNLDMVRAIRVSINDYGPLIQKGTRRAAANNVRKLVKRLLVGSHQETFIVVDSPNEQPRDWLSLLNIADELGIPINGIGIQVEKNEQTDENVEKNENDPNLTMFIASMYKYVSVRNEHDIADVIRVVNEADGVRGTDV